MATNTALIAGALGVVGRALVEHLDGLDEWQAIGLSRRPPDFETAARFVSVDLLDADDCRRKLADLTDVTHVFFAAYIPRPTLAEEVGPNTAMLANLVETIEPAADALRHVQLMEGSKWYGNHLGPYRTPAREDDPGHMPPNFYFDQQRWLEEAQKGRDWTWSALRPHGIIGFAVGSAMNQLTALAIYAVISRHLGLPLRFPGQPGAFTAVYQMTEAVHLARGMVWAATSPAAANQAFNLTNGDFTRWCNLWPIVARFFDMEVGPVQTLRLEDFMADKEPLWAEICQQHQLRKYRLDELTNWRFADFVYACDYDQMSSMTKARKAGWHDVVDTEDMIRRQLERLRRERIIP